jgi:hypothetical protein
MSTRPDAGDGATTYRDSAKDHDTPLQPSLDDLTAQAKDAVHEATDAATSLGADLKEAANAATKAAKAQASGFAADVGHELSKSAEGQKQRGVEGMQALARAINSAAAELEGQSPQVAKYVRDAAQRVEGFSGNIHGRNVNELLDAAASVARKQPAVFLAGAAVAGFALTRFLKSSARSTSAQASPKTAMGSDPLTQPMSTGGARQGG